MNTWVGPRKSSEWAQVVIFVACLAFAVYARDLGEVIAWGAALSGWWFFYIARNFADTFADEVESLHRVYGGQR